MSDLFGFLKNLFGRDDSEKNKLPFLHQSIDLKSFPMEKVNQWVLEGGSDHFSNLLNNVYRDYYIMGNNQSSHSSVTILDSSHSNGWFLHCGRLNFTDTDYKYFAHRLSDKLKEMGYVIQLAELKSLSRSEGVEAITHYYLKPSLKYQFVENQEQTNQLYGNISLEYKALNGSPSSFKFLAKAYSDSKYLPPKDFSDLIQILFDNKPD